MLTNTVAAPSARVKAPANICQMLARIPARHQAEARRRIAAMYFQAIAGESANLAWAQNVAWEGIAVVIEQTFLPRRF